MNILLSNDDGLQAEGIRVMARALRKGGHKVYLSAPASQMSGAGHSISTTQVIGITPTTHEGAEQALKIAGTPSDCVKLGLKYYRTKGIIMDLVVSGINHGANLGTDTLYSGTVAGAVEGALCGYRAIAVSVESHTPVHFETAADLAMKVLAKMQADKSGPRVININTPDLPAEELAGVLVSRLGRKEYVEGFLPEETEGGYIEYQYRSTPVVYDSHDTDIDVIAAQDNYATLTPLGYDLTDYPSLETMKEWRIEL